jgi:hypothetical protein
MYKLSTVEGHAVETTAKKLVSYSPYIKQEATCLEVNSSQFCTFNTKLMK